MFTDSGNYWHVVCDKCGSSLFDQLDTAVTNKHVARTIATAFDWRIEAFTVVCNVCRIISAGQ